MWTNRTSPIVVDLGKIRREHVGQLRNGAGRLAEDVEEVMRLIRSSLDSVGENRVLLPVVVVYTEVR